MDMIFLEKPPAARDYFELFNTTDWNETYQAEAEELRQAIAGSWYTLSAYDNRQKLIGFGRIVSDGVLYALVCDMIVEPACQGKGVGSALLEKLIQRCQEGGIRVIWLCAASGRSGFYKKFGFEERPHQAPGMQLTLCPENE